MQLMWQLNDTNLIRKEGDIVGSSELLSLAVIKSAIWQTSKLFIGHFKPSISANPAFYRPSTRGNSSVVGTAIIRQV